MPERITICEVGPRDGLQNEPNPISTQEKLRMIDGLVAAGLDYIETASFVRPDLVPQMADAAAVFQGSRHHDIHNMVLIINEKGYDRALAAGASSMASVVMVSETMSRRNSNMSVAQSIQVGQRLALRAARDNVRMRIYVSTAWHCPYEGPIPATRVLRVAEKLIALEPDELALADTIGHANPLEVGTLIEMVARRIDINRIAVHLHDTQALGLANAYAAIRAGVRIVDASVGGLGGCPFAPGAKGNLATEDLVLLAEKMGFETNVDRERLIEVVATIAPLVGRSLGGRTLSEPLRARCTLPV